MVFDRLIQAAVTAFALLLLTSTTAFSEPSFQCPIHPLRSTDVPSVSESRAESEKEDLYPLGRAPATPLRWRVWSRQALHSLAGDDLQAYFGFEPELQLITTHLPNAYANENRSVVLSSGLLKLINSESELAFILAHELGHIVLNHSGRSSLIQDSNREVRFQEHLNFELEADRYALTLMEDAGYDRSAALSVLRRLSGFGNGSTTTAGLNRSYPTLPMRQRVVLEILQGADRSAGFTVSPGTS